jgi:4-amino-4-deoxy-L-arabinose transferase-like glycosyltransferase
VQDEKPVLSFVTTSFRLDSTARLWLLYALAAASFLTTLHLPYIGEEAVYTISSMEMWTERDFLVPTLFGSLYGRPPLYNWLIIPVANLFGWDHVLVAARLVTACASALTGLVLAWLSRNLTGDRTLAAFAALIYLSGDMLFYRGWLAYSDPLFGMFVFAAIACAWVGLEQDRPLLIWMAIVSLTCAFLTKVETAYLFYGVSLSVLLAVHREYRTRLFRPSPIAAHVAGAAAFLIWHHIATGGTDLQDSNTADQIINKLSTVDLADYFRQIALFPLETFAELLPVSAVAVWFWVRDRKRRAAIVSPASGFAVAPLIWILALNFLPYYLGPRSHIRYIVPLYPLFALLLAVIIWRLGMMRFSQTVRWLSVAIALKYVFALWAFPMHQERFRGNQIAAAEQIEQRTKGFPLYANDGSAAGLAVTARINERRSPKGYLHWPPAAWTDGFLMSHHSARSEGEHVVDIVTQHNEKIYLLCRGKACPEH